MIWNVYVWNINGSFSIDKDLDLRDWTLNKVALLFEMIEVLAKLLELYNNQVNLKSNKKSNLKVKPFYILFKIFIFHKTT